MYILTIFEITDDIEIMWQQAAPDKRILQSAAVTWAKENGWEVEDDEQSIDEQFADVQGWFDNMAEGDDPRMILRKADG
ncbi:MAG: hypothetical protein WCK70_05030 [Chloroflexales bacterium]